MPGRSSAPLLQAEDSRRQLESKSTISGARWTIGNRVARRMMFLRWRRRGWATLTPVFGDSPAARASAAVRGPSPPECLMLALFNTELPAADDAFALVRHWPSGTVSTKHFRIPALLLPSGVVGKEFRIVIAPAPPPAVVLYFAESVRQGITVGPDHPSELDVCRRLPDHGKRIPEAFEQRCVARPDDLPRCQPDTVRIVGKQIAKRVGHPARIGRVVAPHTPVDRVHRGWSFGARGALDLPGLPDSATEHQNSTEQTEDHPE